MSLIPDLNTAIHDLRSALTDARAEADRYETKRTGAGRAREDARSQALDHEAAAQSAKIFGRIPTPTSRHHERLATEARTEMERQNAAQIAAAPAANAANAKRVRIERRLERALQDLDAEMEDADRERRNEQERKRADAARDEEIREEEAHVDDRSEVREQEEQPKLEADDGLDLDWEDPWSAPADEDDGGYAEAAEEARQDQIAVVQLDRSIDADERTHDEVYTPEGNVRPDLLRDEPEPEADTEPALPERDQNRDAAPEREQRTAATPDIGIDEPF